MNRTAKAFRRAMLKMHKRKLRNGLACPTGCPFHKEIDPDKVIRSMTGTWYFMYCAEVDRLAKEGVFGDD